MLFHIRKQLGIAAALLIPFVFASQLTNQTLNPYPSNSSLSSYKVAAYFVNWAIYGRNYTPQELPASQLSHVLYAFANVQADGTVFLSDTWADTEKHFDTDSWLDKGTNVYGCIKQLYLLKKKNRHMKTLLSIGGWTYSTNFAAAASTNKTRAKFANTTVEFVKDLGFDGIDIDWEYPTDDTEASNFVLLLQEIRTALDTYSTTNNISYKFLLTVASPAGSTNYNKLHLKEMDTYLDAWHLMAYDYAGSWANVTGHDANLYHCAESPASTPFSTDAAVQAYISAGVNASKIIMGMPIYGRSFENTTGIGKSYNRIGSGTWEAGVYDYKALPLPGSKVTHDIVLGASYSYDAISKQLISYDTIEIVQQKIGYIKERGLGGAMFWESSADGKGNLSLILAAGMGLGGLDLGENWLGYLGSRYDNVADNMGNGTVGVGNTY